MRYRLAPLVAALGLLLVACGSDDDDAADETTTTTAATPSTTGSTIAPQPEANAGQIARVVVQIDDQLRRAMTDGAPCLNGPYEECTPVALDAYDTIRVSAEQTTKVLPDLVREGSLVYQGRPSADVQGRIDETVNSAAVLMAAFDVARAACVPDFGDGCPEANEALRVALDELLKSFNRWRVDYVPIVQG